MEKEKLILLLLLLLLLLLNAGEKKVFNLSILDWKVGVTQQVTEAIC